jgi:hypothetical protein
MARKRAGFYCSCGQPLSSSDEGNKCGACARPETQAALKVVFAALRPEPVSRVVKVERVRESKYRTDIHMTHLANGQEVWVNDAGEPI